MNKIKIVLHTDEIELLRSIILTDDEVERIVENAAHKDGLFTMHFNDVNLEILLEHLAAESNHAPNKKRQNELDELFSVIENQSDQKGLE